jgi:type I restriction enzyme S subunit
MATAPSTPKAGWEVKTLGEVCEIARGGSPRPIKKFITEADDGINWIKIGDATASDKYIYETKQKIKPEGISRSRMVNPGDFLLSNSMSFGRPYIMKTTGCIHDGWLVLSDKSGEFNPDYLYYYLGSQDAYKQFDGLAAGSTVRNLNIDLVRGVTVPLPPLPEQERIVGILDEAFEGIAAATAQAEKNLHNARELFQSVLQSTFSQKGDDWVETTLGECGATQTGSTPKKANPEHYGNHIPFIKPGDFNENGSLNYDNEGLSASGLSVSRLVQENSALMVCIGATIGKSGWCEREITTNQQINALTPRENLYAKFAYYQFTTSSFQNLVHGSSGQATLPIINKSKWCNLPFVLPPLPTQQAIVEKLDALSEETKALEAIYERKQSALAELKQSLLQKAFAGEL